MATINLTAKDFREKVFDYTTEKEWNYKGDKPAIIDFYADWCGPCQMVAPIFEEISNERDDVVIYKVDTEAEQELSALFQIRSIPSLLFIPTDAEKKPMMQNGALPKHALEEIIEKELVAPAEQE
ncbi:MAG: thioredoxin [Cytophagales bacterium]|nr:thioredoxin [Cytophagales bacterium]